MKKYLLATTAAGAAMALTAPAHADMYVGIFGGMNKLDDQKATVASGSGNFDFYTTVFYGSLFPLSYTYAYFGNYQYTWQFHTSTSYSVDANLDIDNGFVIGAAMGWDFGNGFNLEAEIAYRKNDADLMMTKFSNYHFQSTTVGFFNGFIYLPTYTTFLRTLHYAFATFPGYSFDIPGTKTTSASGEITSFSVMANAWYEFQTSGKVRPFIGGGFGYGKVELDMDGMTFDDSGIAYQAGIGLLYDFGKCQLRFELRHFEVSNIDLSDHGFDLSDVEYKSDEVLIGFRWGF
jgi:opacity protein-like surface antigen